ncbi:hypothetical protein KR009_010612 [Drosophila setifemur]|nr:hypothetical protein KR009_010612 [Drosophila setifemur]
MGLRFQQLKKLWLLYLFLLFFAFFMFAISINLYVASIQSADSELRHPKPPPKRRSLWPHKNIVAHYIGRGDIFGNMTADDYNINLFQPVQGEGSEGRPVVVPPRDRFRMQRFFRLNSFNLLASDRIPLNRTLKDYRTLECRGKKYASSLPSTSVIIVFHNEAWSVLLRTITSVINRSPRSLLKEIILVDDASDRIYLKRQLESYIKVLSVPTKIFRMKKRSGLVPARLLGAENARGDVLTFLDAHCECSRGWLEPLLGRIKENRNVVICPVIDIISDDNFSYTKSFENHWGAFNWQLSFRWFSSERKRQTSVSKDSTAPIATPAMAGGLFAIDRKYFYEMGSYDSNMRVWGGENVEMSFRIWQCGGRVEISPCSHVGHVFRSSTPYTFPGGMSEVLTDNLARAATVWMDDWQYFVMLYTHGLSLGVKDKVNVTERVALREKLQCKPFSWYLEHIWPEHFFPAPDRFFGKIIWLDGETECAQAYSKHMKSLPGRDLSREWKRAFEEIDSQSEQLLALIDLDRDKCLRPLKEDVPRSSLSPVTVGDCTSHAQTMDMFVITHKGQIMTNDNVCLTYRQPKLGVIKMLKNRNATASNVMLTQCASDSSQLWTYNMDTQQISHRDSKLCLTLKAATNARLQKIEKVVLSMECNFQDITQKWGFVPLPWRI